MKKIQLSVLLLMAASLFITGCGGDDGEGGKPAVYVAGCESDGTSDIATVWKDGVAERLQSGSYGAVGYGVTVSGGDVYVGGYYKAADPYHSDTYFSCAALWKNGERETLGHEMEYSCSRGVIVSGGNTYMGGYGVGAILWKNNEREVVITNGVNTLVVYGFTISGGKSYLAGYEIDAENPPFITCARLWVDGEEQPLSGNSNYSLASGVAVSGGKVYVAGHVRAGSKFRAALWTDGSLQYLSDGTRDAHAFSIAVSGGNVYVGGEEHNGTCWVATIWKNGTAQRLSDGTTDAYVYSVFVFNGDVYAAGCKSNGTKKVATLWKNGEPTALSDGTQDAEAFSVYVAK